MVFLHYKGRLYRISKNAYSNHEKRTEMNLLDNFVLKNFGYQFQLLVLIIFVANKFLILNTQKIGI